MQYLSHSAIAILLTLCMSVKAYDPFYGREADYDGLFSRRDGSVETYQLPTNFMGRFSTRELVEELENRLVRRNAKDDEAVKKAAKRGALFDTTAHTSPADLSAFAALAKKKTRKPSIDLKVDTAVKSASGSRSPKAKGPGPKSPSTKSPVKAEKV
ncbi:hypothetical protein CVT24_006337 [Panaeolus cyanescens]|uniref:Secreted protein n=1 Tax=Panaeolus cyanescens TaxID=181874 RepID=A0A409YEC6_9AGAR|nr:hypothetical protein CVT24_006337 [Panaeolus cyanescens]